MIRTCIVAATLATGLAGCRSDAPTPGSARAAIEPVLRRGNVLLVTIDTLRADRVGAYGSRAGLTPTLDRLAGEGIRIDRAYAHVPLTLPSHTALMTGALPFTNGVRDNGSFRFDGQRPTLAAALKGAGYRTGGFVASFVLDARFGLNAGFDEYDDRNGSRSAGGDLSVLERRADAVVDAALRWIGPAAPSAPPWFAWLHLYDPHDPYDPPEPYKTRLAGDAYGGEIAFADAQLGRALQTLRERGQLDRTLVVVAADHGESLGEHQERTHGLFVYEATTRVPLLFWAPGALAPAVVAGPAGLVDVMPTVLELVGAPAVPGDGRSLWPAARGQAGEDRDVYLEALNANLTRHWAPLTALVAGPAKFIDLPQAEFYDLAADPGETRNLHASRTDAASTIARRLFALRARGRPAAPSAVDDDTARRLRSLGYVVTPAARSGGETYGPDDDPKALVGLHNTLDDALAAVKAGRNGDAERLLQQALATRPDFSVATDRLAQLYRDTGRLRLAIATLEAASRAGHADAASLAALGGYLQEAGNLERSADVLEAARSLNPAEMEVYEKLGITYTRLGNAEQAHAMFAHMLQAAPNSATTLNNLGSLYLSQRRWDEALATLTKAIAIDPLLANAYNGRGVAYAQQGQFDRAIAEWRRALELRPDLADARDNIARAQQLKRTR